MRYRSRSALTSALLGGFIAGSVDIGAACLLNRLNPVVICQYIAMGVLGRRSLELELRSAALGLVLQWAMSILIAMLFGLTAEKLTPLRRNWAWSGIALGAVTFFVMNYVVVPVSAVHSTPHFTAWTFGENMLAMLVFGLIISFFARDTYRPGHISIAV